MAKGKTHIVRHRRRRESRTDYRLRLDLLKSGKHRLVIRKSLNNITCQIIEHNPKGDMVLVSADSRNLKAYGWNGHCGNIPAAYLTGLLCGTNAKKAGIKDAVADIGLYASVKGSRLYAALKGAVDGGLAVPHSEDVLPAKDRIEGKHTKDSEKTAKEFIAAIERIAGKPDKKPAGKDNPKPKTDKTRRPI